MTTAYPRGWPLHSPSDSEIFVSSLSCRRFSLPSSWLSFRRFSESIAEFLNLVAQGFVLSHEPVDLNLLREDFCTLRVQPRCGLFLNQKILCVFRPDFHRYVFPRDQFRRQYTRSAFDYNCPMFRRE